MNVSQPKTVINASVANQSVRSGYPKILVIHTTEGPNSKGTGDLKGIASYFDRPEVEASSTIVVDGEGFSGRLMPDSSKPWTQASYNSVSLSIENIGYAATSKEDWFNKYHNQLETNAAWLAYWSDEWEIPLRRAITLSGGVQRSGVATHKQLGQYGGGHVDPGQGFPLKYILKLARYYKLKAKAPNSKRFKAARNSVNKIRRYYGIEEVK